MKRTPHGMVGRERSQEELRREIAALEAQVAAKRAPYDAEISRIDGELRDLVAEVLKTATPEVVLSLERLAAIRKESLHMTVAMVMREEVSAEQMSACLSPKCREVADALRAEWGIDEREACYRAMYKDPCGYAYQGYVLGLVNDEVKAKPGSESLIPEAISKAMAQGGVKIGTILSRLKEELSPTTLATVIKEICKVAKVIPGVLNGSPIIAESALQEILERAAQAEAELQAAIAKKKAELARRELEAAFLKAAAEFRRLKPWTRRLFQFVLDLRLLEPGWGEVRVEVKADPVELRVTVPEFEEPRALPYLDEPWAEIPDIAGRAPGEKGALALDRFLRLYLCAMLAVIDLLTREVRLVDRKREVKKKIHPEKCIPPITYDYRPVIYAPRTLTVVRDRQIEVAMERALEERERKEAEQRAKEEAARARATQEAEEAAKAEGAMKDAIERLNAAPRPMVKHLVACHIRRVRMSVRHQLELAQMMAKGWTPIDREGQEIPFPKSGEYTIIRDSVRGSVEPAVVSRGVVTSLIGEVARAKA